MPIYGDTYTSPYLARSIAAVSIVFCLIFIASHNQHVSFP